MPALQTQNRTDSAAMSREGGGQFVAFTTGGNIYAVPIMAVQEIKSWQSTTPIPRRSPASRGVLDIRGTIVEVLELGVLLGSKPVEPRPDSVVIVLGVEPDETIVGILVDGVFDIIQAGPGDLMPAPYRSGDGLVSAIISHQDRLVSVIEPSRLSLS
jgi:purine-binding chemotaxis protein CheW